MMISRNISNKKSILLSTLSIIMLAGIFALFGCNNKDMVDPIIGTVNKQKLAHVNYEPSILPLKPGGNYWIGSPYGIRKHPIFATEKMHNAIDIVADKGTPVIAPAPGTVVQAGWANAYGNCIKIQHGEKYVTLYAHLSGIHVKKGDQVNTNDVIGFVGSTGLSTCDHLHYEIRKYPDIEPVIFYNPADYILNIKEIPDKKNK